MRIDFHSPQACATQIQRTTRLKQVAKAMSAPPAPAGWHPARTGRSLAHAWRRCRAPAPTSQPGDWHPAFRTNLMNMRLHGLSELGTSMVRVPAGFGAGIRELRQTWPRIRPASSLAIVGRTRPNSCSLGPSYFQESWTSGPPFSPNHKARSLTWPCSLAAPQSQTKNSVLQSPGARKKTRCESAGLRFRRAGVLTQPWPSSRRSPSPEKSSVLSMLALLAFASPVMLMVLVPTPPFSFFHSLLFGPLLRTIPIEAGTLLISLRFGVNILVELPTNVKISLSTANTVRTAGSRIHS